MSGWRGRVHVHTPFNVRLNGFESRDHLERHLRAAEFHGREVARFLRQAKFGKSARQTSQLIRKAKEHARIAWGAAVRAESAVNSPTTV